MAATHATLKTYQSAGRFFRQVLMKAPEKISIGKPAHSSTVGQRLGTWTMSSKRRLIVGKDVDLAMRILSQKPTDGYL